MTRLKSNTRNCVGVRFCGDACNKGFEESFKTVRCAEESEEHLVRVARLTLLEVWLRTEVRYDRGHSVFRFTTCILRSPRCGTRMLQPSETSFYDRIRWRLITYFIRWMLIGEVLWNRTKCRNVIDRFTISNSHNDIPGTEWSQFSIQRVLVTVETIRAHLFSTIEKISTSFEYNRLADEKLKAQY